MGFALLNPSYAILRLLKRTPSNKKIGNDLLAIQYR
jgi:hypothetical protein